ncbi:MAG: hypothetical protein ABI355_15320 [Solirubrobacteraceae bacterium]
MTNSLQNPPLSSPERDIEALIEEARRRQRRRRRAISAVLLALVAITLVALDGAGGSKRPDPSRHAATRRAAQTVALPGSDTTLLLWPAGAPIFGDLPGGGRGTTVNVDNLKTGKVAVKRIPDIAGGDFPHQIVAVGRWLVYNSGRGVAAIGDDLTGTPRILGAATWFVPSVRGHVLLVHVGANSTSPASVRSVSVATGARGPAVTLPHDTQIVVEGTDRGLLLLLWRGRRSKGVAELWRPGHPPIKLAIPSEDITNEFTADARVAAFGTACRSKEAKLSNGPTGYTVCARLRVLDLADGRSISFPAPRGTLGWVSGASELDTALGTGDTMLAAQAATMPAHDGPTRLFVLRLGRRTTSPVAVPDSTAPIYSRTAWSTSGSWLLYQGPSAQLHAFRLGGKSQTLGVHCCQYAAIVSTPNQTR